MKKGRRFLVTLLLGALIAGLMPVSASAADKKAPRITRAKMKDKDGDGFADRVVLTYSERIKHALDRDGKYPFRVIGYQIDRVAKAKNARKLRIILDELPDPDPTATPNIVYKRTKKQPVKDKARNQARAQTFTATLPFGSAVGRELDVVLAGNGSGSVTSNPAGIACGNTCSASFDDGEAVVLTAAPDAGSTFEGWSGACSGTGTCALTMSQNRAVTATFDTEGPTLTVNRVGSGTVSSSPAGVDCGTTCSSSFAMNTPVTLIATPAQGASFQGWSGTCAGTGSCVVTMNADKTVTATFSGARLTVTKAGTGTGTVESSPAGVDCGTTCAADYALATPVTLTATPGAGSTFTGWSGDCTGTGTCVVTMSADKNVTATFTGTNTLTVTRAGAGTGTVTSSPAGINCGSTCVASYPGSTPVTLTASPAAGSTFTGWSGDCTGTGNCVVTMNGNKTVTATFAGANQLTVTKAGTGTGSVTSSPAGINCGPTCAASYSAGTPVTLTAASDAGSSFVSWTGACTGATPSCNVTMDAAKNVTATFDLIPVDFTLTVTKAGSGTGTVSSLLPDPGTIECGTTCAADYATGTQVTLVAASSLPSSTFIGWGGDAASCGTNPQCVLTMDADKTVVATFDTVVLPLNAV